MEMTFNNYIQNPMGKENAVYSARGMYKDLYTSKLNQVLVRENGKIDYQLFTNKDDYIVYMKIPSEVIENFYYDVVIHFYTKDTITKASRSILDYNVHFFSNDPSFVFTFAHSFIENKLLFEDLKSKLSSEVIKKVAVMKNPTNQVGYVKSIYFTFLIMKDKGLFNKIKFEAEGNPYDKTLLLKQVQHSDDKIRERVEKGAEVKKKEAINKKKERNERNHAPQDDDNIKYTQNKDSENKNISNIAKRHNVVKRNIRKTKFIKRI